MHILIIGLISDVFFYTVTGFSGMICWNWFVPEIFTSAPRMTFANALGLIVVGGVFIQSGKQYSLEDMKDGIDYVFWNELYSSLMTGVSKPLCILFIGWIVHFMLF